MDIQFPIILIGDGDLIKYKTLEDAELDLEAYSLELYSVYDSNCRKVKLYKKNKYNHVGFILEDEISLCQELKQKIQEYGLYYELTKFTSDDIIKLLESIPYYEISLNPISQRINTLWKRLTS